MKCEKCGEAEATVYYTVITGKFKAMKKKYCRKCMETERVRLTPTPTPPANVPQGEQSVLGLVQEEMAKADKTEKDEPAGMSPEKRIKKLEKKMQAAIGDEHYEEAAKIRDEIAILSKQVAADKPSLAKESGDKKTPSKS